MEKKVEKQRYERKEQEIDLIRLMWSILMKWRQLIVWAIIMAVVVGGLGYGKAVMDYRDKLAKEELKSDYKNTNDLTEAISHELTAQKMREVEYMVEQYRMLERAKENNEKSIYQQLNGYQVERMYLQFYVEVQDEAVETKGGKATDINLYRKTLADSLLAAYCKKLQDDESVDVLLETAGLEVDREQMNFLLGIGREGESVFSVNVTLTDTMDADRIQQVFLDLVNKKQAELTLDIPHTVKLMESGRTTSIDYGIIDQQNKMLENVYDQEKKIAEAREKFSDEQKNYLFALLSIDEDNAVSGRAIETNGLELKKPSLLQLKYIVIGLFLGVFAICFLEALRLMMSSSLTTAEELFTIYQLKLFGEINLISNKKRFFAGLDHWLKRKRDRGKKERTQEDELKTTIRGIVLHCRQNDIQKIALTGTELEKLDQTILKRLTEGILAGGIEVETVNDIYYDPDALTVAAEIANAVVVEQLHVSAYDEIANELITADEYRIHILGTVCIAS